MAEKVVLAYSGGLDTSIIIPWLKENYGYDVIAMGGDVGQGDDIEPSSRRRTRPARARCIVEDMREEFLTEYLFPAVARRRRVRAQVSAGHVARAAGDRQASGGSRAARRRDALAHGCTGKGNDQVRFELAYQALAPQLKVIAPWREWDSEVARRLPRLRRGSTAFPSLPAARRSTAATAISGTSATRAANWKTRQRAPAQHLEADQFAAGGARPRGAGRPSASKRELRSP